MSKYTEEELELLSDEEREALEEDMDEDDEEQDLEEGEGSDDDGEDEATDADEAATPQEDPAAQADDTPDPDAAQDAPPTAPVAEIQAAQQTIDGLKGDKTKLLADYNDGEIDEEEFQTKLEEIITGISEASSTLGALKAQQADADKAWHNSVTSHLQAYPEIEANPAWFAAMDAQVVALSSQPAFASMSFDKLLKAAHSTVAASADAMGVSGFPALRVDPGKATPPPKPATPAQKQNKGLGAIPETLRDIPAAAATDPDESEAAELEKLPPDEYEAAWAMMTDEKRERLLRFM